MKAMTREVYGTADVLRLRDVEVPSIGDDEVLVRVRAAAVGPEVWHVLTGRPYLVRLFGFGLRRPKDSLIGADLAGTVEQIGARVTDVRPGDDLFGSGVGCLAEYARAGADRIVPKPANLTFEQAAALPVSGCTALQALRDRGRIRAGQQVLVIGASGGVGTFAVQLAKAFGATVTGVCSTAKVDLVGSLGADHVIDYTQQEVTESGQRYDLVVDTAGRRPLRRLRRVLTPRGTLVIVGGEGGGRWTGGFGRQLVRAPLLSLFGGQRMSSLSATSRREDLVTLSEMCVAGTLTPVVGRTLPLSEAADALRDADEGHGRGKTVVTV